MKRQTLYNDLNTDTKTNVIANELFDELRTCDPATAEGVRYSLVAVLFHSRDPESKLTSRDDIQFAVDLVCETELDD